MPWNWHIHIDNMPSKASGRVCILRVCKSYGYSKDQLNNLFYSLVMSVVLYGIRSHEFLVMIMYFMMCYLQRGDVCSVSASMTLYCPELKPNASSIVSLTNASLIKFTVYKELHNVTYVTMLQFSYIPNYTHNFLINIL